MELCPLTAISPIDGRYRNKTEILDNYYSEFALIRYRVKVEIEYFIALCEIPLPQLSDFDKNLFPKLRDIYNNFSLDNATFRQSRIRKIQRIYPLWLNISRH